MVEIYLIFSKDWESCLDFSDEMKIELYRFETYGLGKISPSNGYAQGKKWMDVTLAMWREDFDITLTKDELYEDSKYPHWWLDKVLHRC